MAVTKNKSKSEEQLEQLIDKALEKLGTESENEICRYLPVNGGYMHHFTLRKMKTEAPEELVDMINKFIVKTTKPTRVPHKPRAARGSRKRGDNLSLNNNDLKRLLNIARLANDQEMIRKLTPRRSLASVKRELMRTIRQGKVDQELWNQYVETVNHQDDDFNTPESAHGTDSTNSWKDLPGMS